MGKVLQFPRAKQEQPEKPLIETMSRSGAVGLIMHTADGEIIEIWLDANEAACFSRDVLEAALDAGALWE